MQTKKKLDDFITPEMIKRAEETLKKRNAKYCNMQKQYDSFIAERKYVQALQVKADMDKVMREVVTNMVEQEISQRQTTEELLKMLPKEEGVKYRDLLNILSFCFDSIDYALTDVNDLLKRNGVAFNVSSIPEIKRCKEKVSAVVNAETRRMNDRQQQIYADEADSIYEYLKKRSGVFRRKSDKTVTKQAS